MKRTHENYVKHLECLVKTDQQILSDFARDLTEGKRKPYHVMEWSEGAFAAAARLHVCTLLISTTNIKGAVGYCEQRLIAGARYHSLSSSQSSNLFKQHRLKFLAEMLEELREEWCNDEG